MYTFSADTKPVRLNLCPEMIDCDMKIVPRMLTVDVPLQFAMLSETVQKAILQGLTAEVLDPEQTICRETIAVHAGVACNLDGESVDIDDEIALIACAEVVAPNGETRMVGTILDDVDTCFEGRNGRSAVDNRKAFVSYVMRNMCTCVAENDNTKSDVEIIVP